MIFYSVKDIVKVVGVEVVGVVDLVLIGVVEF